MKRTFPGGKAMHVYYNRNIGYKRDGYKHQRSQRDFPFKKRKVFKCGSFSNSDGEMSTDGISSSPTNDLHGNASGSSKASSGGLFSSEFTPSCNNMHMTMHKGVCV